MATYIKGNAVANATEYVLFEKESKKEIMSMGLGSQDLFTDTNTTSATKPSTGTSSYTGYLFCIGAIPADKVIHGVRLAVAPFPHTSAADATEATQIHGYLFTMEKAPDSSSNSFTHADYGSTLAVKGTSIISAPVNEVSIVDVLFDEPYANTGNKVLAFGFGLNTGAVRVYPNPSKLLSEVCGENDGNTYEAMRYWCCQKTTQVENGITALWGGGYTDNASLAYTLLTEGDAETVYTEKATDNEINFDVSALGLATGAHTFVVKAKADGYEDSDYSNEVTYAVE